MADNYNFQTIGETDFYTQDVVESATHLLIINTNDSSNIPTLLGVELAQAEKEFAKVGYITSKHVLTKPHRLLAEQNPMWPLFQYKETLIAMINSPPVISNSGNAQRNEWLFNYPPARDIVMRFAHLERIGTLTTFALNRLFVEPMPLPSECVVVRGEELGKEDCVETLQALWSWLSPQIAHLIGVESAIYIMPPEKTNDFTEHFPNSAIPSIEPALFKEMTDILRKDGYKIPRGAANRAQKLYSDFTTEALERVKELVGATQERQIADTGAMFQ